jgi:hypothetical protein
MPARKSTVPTPTPTGGRRNKTSRQIKNGPQEMLEIANTAFKTNVEILQQYVDPAAIDPNTVRRLTVEMRTSANALKKVAHLIEQQSGTPRTKTPPADSGVTSTGAEGVDPTLT